MLFCFALGLAAQETDTVTATPSEPQRPLRNLVVADIETRVPMRGAVVITKDGWRDTTNWRGLCQVPVQFDTLLVVKSGYLPETTVAKELGDTTYLIPSENAIKETVVWGQKNTNERLGVGTGKKQLKSGPGQLFHFDVARWLDTRTARDQRHLRKVRESFQEMDKYSDDPIEDAYYRALEEERLKKEREAAQQERDNAHQQKQDAKQ